MINSDNCERTIMRERADAGGIGADVVALALDDTLFCPRGQWRRQEFVPSIVDASPGRTAQLLDVVEGRSVASPVRVVRG